MGFGHVFSYRSVGVWRFNVSVNLSFLLGPTIGTVGVLVFQRLGRGLLVFGSQRPQKTCHPSFIGNSKDGALGLGRKVLGSGNGLSKRA